MIPIALFQGIVAVKGTAAAMKAIEFKNIMPLAESIVGLAIVGVAAREAVSGVLGKQKSP